MLNKNRVFINILKVIASNLTNVLLGFAMTFILPKYIGVFQDLSAVANYGYFQKYSLYASYLGMFMIGFNDGVNLLYAKEREESIDKLLIRSFFKTAALWVIIVSSLCMGVLFSIPKMNIYDRIVFIFVIIDIILFNLNGFFLHINQILERYNFYSIAQILARLLFVVLMFVLILCKVHAFYYFLTLNIFCSVGVLIYNLITSKKFVFGKSYKIKEIKKEIKDCVKSGFFVMGAALLAIFLTTYPRVIVDNVKLGGEFFFSQEQFSWFSFSNSMLSIVLQVMAAIGVVMYPIIRKMNENKLESVKDIMLKSILYSGTFLLLSYYPVYLFVYYVLPAYRPSLGYLFLLYPQILYQAKNNIVTYTYYKTLRKEKFLFFILLGLLALSVGVTLGAFYLVPKIETVALVSTVMIMFNSIILDLIFHRSAKWKIRWFQYFDCLTLAAFILINWFISNIFISMGVYAVYVLIFLALRNKDIKEILNMFFKKGKSFETPNVAGEQAVESTQALDTDKIGEYENSLDDTKERNEDVGE